MPDLIKKIIDVDNNTGISSGIVSYANAKLPFPNKFATTTEVNASRIVNLKQDFPTELIIAGKLIYPETLKRVLKNEDFLKEFARRLSRETSRHEEALSMLFLVMKGESDITDTEDFRTILDLQFFAGLDIISLQQGPKMSHDDFYARYRYAERWIDNRGLDKPLMPILSPSADIGEFEKTLKQVLKREPKVLGLDMKGGFYYHALRAIEAIKDKAPELWVHAFQIPPKIRFAHSLLRCSEGMVLPFFGVDSYNRWVVPPPPTPLTKDKINKFDASNWGVFKRSEWSKEYGTKLNCNCPMCDRRQLRAFYQGEVLTVLGRSKIHDHYAQRDQLFKLAAHVKSGDAKKFVSRKRYLKDFLNRVEASDKVVKA